eukprot:TRINITY_DN42459_c0_g1_i1.p1 TRINITY_DN42459_c0_g1~~TRINITY_DN42459_c0_g1_i1.p1  ORF type:complete len:354 (+),score=96.75 TRINITY_DN42459_c0_g1_i1:63-1124(+)
MADEWMEASEQGNVLKLQALFKSGTQDRNSAKVANCVVAAAYANRGDAVVAYLEWGVNPNTADKFNRRLLHSCCRQGLAGATAACLEKKADVTACDFDRGTPMGLALKASKDLPTVRELLRVGVEIPPGPGTDLPGLATVMHEVRMEIAAKGLRALAGSSVDPKELSEAEEQVWASMKEHMRLIKMKEDCQAARVLVDLEQKAAEEQKAALEAQRLESKIKDQLTETKVSLQAAETAVFKSRKDLDKIKADLEEQKQADEKMREDLDQKKRELREISGEANALEKARLDAEQYAKDVLAEQARLVKEVEDQKVRNADLEIQLQTAREELQGWMADKERAAKLSAKAHRLMSQA